jgi:hypothetical protein
MAQSAFTKASADKGHNGTTAQRKNGTTVQLRNGIMDFAFEPLSLCAFEP